ncbi:MAG: FeoB-associated Cys-rich membrane protein [Ruminococcaceae bacterium]|nr:FeoB-associated Cys-rich membrane protein [Oscillospiraceae bacterium]
MEYLILGIVLAWLIAALVWIVRRKKNGCNGCCDNCASCKRKSP